MSDTTSSRERRVRRFLAPVQEDSLPGLSHSLDLAMLRGLMPFARQHLQLFGVSLALMPLVAQTYALNFGLNFVQQTYAALTRREGDAATKAELDQSAYEELVRLCCIVKPLVTWHAENAATTCRERCGGQGFLSANRFGEGIVGAHAGITAEGDNRVICQKVAKELLTNVSKDAVKKHVIAQKVPSFLRSLFGGGCCLRPSSLGRCDRTGNESCTCRSRIGTSRCRPLRART